MYKRIALSDLGVLVWPFSLFHQAGQTYLICVCFFVWNYPGAKDCELAIFRTASFLIFFPSPQNLLPEIPCCRFRPSPQIVPFEEYQFWLYPHGMKHIYGFKTDAFTVRCVATLLYRFEWYLFVSQFITRTSSLYLRTENSKEYARMNATLDDNVWHRPIAWSMIRRSWDILSTVWKKN